MTQLIQPTFDTPNQEKWSRHYYKLCNRALDRKPKKGAYYEQHHMLPKCQWGKNKILVLLTPEEHYVAHQLLVKMYPADKKLAYAVNMMGYTRQNAKTYGWVRRKRAEAASQHLTGRKISDETKQKISAAKKGRPGPKHTEETKQKIRDIRTGQPRSEETKAKLSEALKGRPGLKGRKISDEAKKKISAAKLGKQRKPFSDETRQKMKESQQRRRYAEMRNKDSGK